MYLFKLVFSISSDKYPEMELLSHMIGLFLVFLGTSMLFSRASQVVLVIKNPPANGGDLKDMGLTPGSGRSPGVWHGNAL